MQKKIIALAIAAAFATPVVAMADVTVYGTMDGGIRHQTNNSDAAGGTTDSMKMGQYNTARWGFKSVEDMGDGMKTNVVLETSLAPAGVGANTDINPAGVGTVSTTNPFGLIFDRQATIGLEGGWGKFDMGWNYTTSFSTIVTYDPFAYKYLGVAYAKTSDFARYNSLGKVQNQDRAGNLIYKNTFGGVTVQLEYDMNDAFQSRQPKAGAARAIGVTYVGGPINVGAAYTASETDAGQGNAATNATVGAGYNFGDGKVSVGYAKNAVKQGVIGDNTATNMWLGASFNMSSTMGVTAAYYKRATNNGVSGVADVESNVIMAGLTYNLSKKTQAYFELDKTTVVGTGGAQDVLTTGTSAGISTAF